MKCIIPAAGFGTRVEMKPNQSKEMLPDKDNYGKPLIQWSLDLCKLFKMEPIVITREDKKDLRQYLFDYQIKFIDIKVEGEWNDSILKSKSYWSDNNLLLLPDTRFDRIKCIEDIENGLKLGNNAMMALHKVNDPEKWGIISNYTLYEKPHGIVGPQYAWGLIGFKNHYGEMLFSNSFCDLNDVGFTFLNKFEDLTRGSK